MRAIITALALAMTLISLPASAQQRGVPCGSVFVPPTAHRAGVTGFAARECDPPRQQESVRLQYPGNIVLGPRRLNASAYPINSPIVLGGLRAHHPETLYENDEGFVQRQARQHGSRREKRHVHREWTKTVHVAGKTVHCCANNVPEGWNVR